MEGMLGQFGHGLKNVSYFFCVFFLGNVRTIGISLVRKTQFLSLLPVSRRFTHYPSWLHNLVAYVVGLYAQTWQLAQYGRDRTECAESASLESTYQHSGRIATPGRSLATATQPASRHRELAFYHRRCSH